MARYGFMRGLLAFACAALVAAGCATPKPPVATYGPPPPVREPTPTPNEELVLLLGDQLTEQEQRDLVALRAARYEPPPGARPPRLQAGLESLLREEGAVLIDEKIGYDIPIVLNDRVEWWIDYFATRIPDSFERYLIRSGAWAPYLKQRLRDAGLPEDMVYLSMIESGFSSRAVSRASAVGPWQFMSYTGREYGLRIDRWVDERMDWEAATSAAIAYLSDLHAMFGSWYLAAAGYNGGQGRVGRSMVADNTTNFWELTNLHEETKNYVPKLIAATLMAKEPERYGFGHVAYLDPVEWETVTVPTSTGLDVVAAAAEVSTDMIRMLNPHLIQGRTPPGERNFPVKVPAGRAETFNDNFYRVTPQERLAVVATHPVREGETLTAIARVYGVGVRELLRENGLPGEAALEPGMTLKIPGEQAATGATSGDDGGTVDRGGASERRLETDRVHRVRRGETLSSIGRQYGVTASSIQAANGLRSEVIRPGQRLKIP